MEPASDTVDIQVSLINTFKAIERIPPPDGQKFHVLAYALSKEVVDGDHGMYICMGVYRYEEDAVKRVKFIIETTGFRSLFVAPVCQWRPLTTRVLHNRIEVPVGKDGKLIKFHQEQVAQEEEARELRRKIELDILSDASEREVPGTLSHYIYLWYMIITERTKYEYFLSEASTTRGIYENLVASIRKQNELNPSFEDTWLDTFEKKATLRQESNIIPLIKSGSLRIKREIFPPPEDKEKIVQQENLINRICKLRGQDIEQKHELARRLRDCQDLLDTIFKGTGKNIRVDVVEG